MTASQAHVRRTARTAASGHTAAGGRGEPPPTAGRRAAGEQLARRTGRVLLRWLLGVLLRWLLGVLLGWLLVAFAHQVVTGSFWLWGIPDPLPLLLFFAGPLVVLAAITMLLLARSALPRPDRILVSLAAAALGLIVLHLALSGRTWLWDIPDLMPPAVYLLLPLALLAAVAALTVRRQALARRTRWWVTLLALGALVLGAGQSGLNLRALRGGAGGTVPPGAIRVASWDTLQWDTGGNPGRFYRYLTGQHADVYLLQDYAHPASGPPRLVDDSQRLRSAFPGYYFATAGDLLTISRFPVAASAAFETNPAPPAGTANIYFLKGWKYSALRTDLRIGGRIFSVYNVHFFDRFYLNVVPLTPTFFRNVRGLDVARRAQFTRLRADISKNPHPLLASGNFNTQPDGGDLRLGSLTDAATRSRSPYPATFAFFGPALWRVDLTFTTPAVGVRQYDIRDPHGMSTHSLQDVLVSLPSR